MPKEKAEPVLKFMEEFMFYDDGDLFWRSAPPPGYYMSRNLTGAIGSVDTFGHKPYKKMWRIRIEGRSYLRSHLVYLFHHKHWPKPFCLHRDTDLLNDRIENLFEGTVNRPRRNIETPYRSKADSLPKGVYFRPTKRACYDPYVVAIDHRGCTLEYSRHPTVEDATIRAEEVYAFIDDDLTRNPYTFRRTQETPDA